MNLVGILHRAYPDFFLHPHFILNENNKCQQWCYWFHAGFVSDKGNGAQSTWRESKGARPCLRTLQRCSLCFRRRFSLAKCQMTSRTFSSCRNRYNMHTVFSIRQSLPLIWASSTVLRRRVCPASMKAQHRPSYTTGKPWCRVKNSHLAFFFISELR